MSALENTPGVIWSWDRERPLGHFHSAATRAAEAAVRSLDIAVFPISRRLRVSFPAALAGAPTHATQTTMLSITLVPRPSRTDGRPIACFRNKRDQDLFFLCLYDIDKESCDAVFGEKG